MRFRVRRHESAEAFLDRAEPWLLRAEAEHNLLLGIAARLAAGERFGEEPPYLATVETDDVVAGCAFRTPPFKLGLTEMPLEAVTALADDVARVFSALPAVMGPEAEAGRFAMLWAERTATTARAGMRQRIYRLERVIEPKPAPPGAMRPATGDDLPIVFPWYEAFEAEARVMVQRSADHIRERLASGSIFLWEDGAVRSMAGVAGRTRHGARIGPVYTPPEHRRRGYAGALTAALSRRMLESGLAFCFLYTDLANPTSNAIYQRIGYRPVADSMDWEFV